MSKHIEEIRLLIGEKLKNGMEQRELVRLLQIPRTTVQKIWKRFIQSGVIDYVQKTDCPPKLYKRDIKKLCLESRRNPFLTAKEVHSGVGEFAKVSGRMFDVSKQF